MTATQPASMSRPEYVFTALLLGFGVVFALGMPPCQTPDEQSHLFRAYHLSEGHLVPELRGDKGCGTVPESLVQLACRFSYLQFHPENQLRWRDMEDMHALALNPEQGQTVNFVGSAYYTFIPYVPQAVAMKAARALGAGPLGCFYAGRLGNLTLAAFLVFWAIRVIPILKLLLGMVALLPMSVHQFASNSPDASTIAVAFLLTALLLRFAVAMRAVARPGEIIALFCLGIWLTLCKFPYALLCLFYWGIPSTKLGSRRRYLWTGAGFILATFALAASLTQLKKYTPPRLGPASSGGSIETQMQFIRAHPLRYAETCCATIAEHGKIWIDQLAWLGWLDTPVNPLTMHAFFILMIIVALGDRVEPLCPTLRARLMALVAAGMCLLVIMTSCYVAGSPAKARLVIGFQGRYLIPLLPLLMLPLSNGAIRVAAKPGWLLALAASGCAGTLLVAVASFARRYYFPPAMQPRFAAVAFMLAMLLVATVMFLVQRKSVEIPDVARTGGDGRVWSGIARAVDIDRNAVAVLLTADGQQGR